MCMTQTASRGLASVIFRSEGQVKPLHQPPNRASRESRCFDLDLIFDFRLVAHPVQHLHHPRLQAVVGRGERRGQRLDGGLSDFTDDLRYGLPESQDKIDRVTVTAK